MHRTSKQAIQLQPFLMVLPLQIRMIGLILVEITLLLGLIVIGLFIRTYLLGHRQVIEI